MAEKSKSCKTCIYWLKLDDREGNAAQGRCRRRPPVVFEKPTRMGVWPKTTADDWCGEHDDG